MVQVLILCTGNSVRSQMAEGYLNFYANKSAIVFSAGLQGTTVNPYAIQVMAEDNIDLSEHTSKSMKTFSGIEFDYLITVCDTPESAFLDTLSYKEWRHFPMPDPSETNETDEEIILSQFRKTRELIKHVVLKFIGQELFKSTSDEALAN